LVIVIAIGFGIELGTNSIGDDAALLKLGALPDNGQLGAEFWRIGTYSFLHFNWLHLALAVVLLGLPLLVGGQDLADDLERDLGGRLSAEV